MEYLPLAAAPAWLSPPASRTIWLVKLPVARTGSVNGRDRKARASLPCSRLAIARRAPLRASRWIEDAGLKVVFRYTRQDTGLAPRERSHFLLSAYSILSPWTIHCAGGSAGWPNLASRLLRERSQSGPTCANACSQTPARSPSLAADGFALLLKHTSRGRGRAIAISGKVSPFCPVGSPSPRNAFRGLPPRCAAGWPGPARPHLVKPSLRHGRSRHGALLPRYFICGGRRKP